MAGQVVHAIQGHRKSYRPLQSILCAGADPVAVIEGLLRLHPFRTFYIADLDALMGYPAQDRTTSRLTSTFQTLDFWLDRGLPVLNAHHVTPVVGSESLSDMTLSILEQAGPKAALSLDFREGVFLGPDSVLKRHQLWPDRVILMNLSRVGSGNGPDFDGMRQLIDLRPDIHFVAAGGVRNERDLVLLQSMGVSATLVASALHSGALTAAMLNQFKPA